jgi:hypothetical protein
MKKDPVDPPCAWTVLYFCLPVKLVARPSTTHGYRDAHVSVPGSCVPRPYPPVPGCLFPVPRCLCIHSPRSVWPPCFVCPAGCGAKVTPECHDVVLLTEASSGVEPEQPPVPQAAFAAASQRPILGTAQRAEDDVLPSALGPSPRAGSRRLGEGTAGSTAGGPPGELTVRAYHSSRLMVWSPIHPLGTPRRNGTLPSPCHVPLRSHPLPLMVCCAALRHLHSALPAIVPAGPYVDP